MGGNLDWITNITTMTLLRTEVSGIHKLRVSDLGEKLTMPMQLSSVSSTHATIVHSGCKATFGKNHSDSFIHSSDSYN